MTSNYCQFYFLFSDISVELFFYIVLLSFCKQLDSEPIITKCHILYLIHRNSYILPFRVNYEPDFLLKNRDKTLSKKKLYQASLANEKSAYISLVSDVANTYINILAGAIVLLGTGLIIISSKKKKK